MASVGLVAVMAYVCYLSAKLLESLLEAFTAV